MTSFKPLRRCWRLPGRLLPAFGQAADDVASLRAELQALKNEYTARVDALEAAHHAARVRAGRARCPNRRRAAQPMTVPAPAGQSRRLPSIPRSR